MYKLFRSIERYLLRHWHWLAHTKLYVIADATDNSVTFSKALFRMLDVMDKEEEPKVYVFRLRNVVEPISKLAYVEPYAFCINPKLEQETQLADIQYNSKHHCVGFESLCPTVNRIFFDYKLKAAVKRVKLSVEYRKSNQQEYYVIMPPYGKSDR